MPAADFSSYKVASLESLSSTKQSNMIQAIQDAVNGLDNANIAAAAAILVSKLAAGADGQVPTSTGGAVSWQTPGAAASAPTGSMTAFAAAAAPSGWLLCDGSAVSRTTYAALFAVIGSTYGAGDGSTTFNLPDAQGRTIYGKGTHATVSALAASDGASLGNRSPSHSHTYALRGPTISGNFVSGTQYWEANTTTGRTSGNSSLTDTPAYLVVNWIIKT